jgi:AcrR family transcriptional regulator
MATQGERRAQTRRALLDAAAELFASRGVDGASIDAVAEVAGRTSGAVYDHFGGKEGLLFALLEGWVDDVAAVIGAELATATTLEERMAALWRNVSDPVAGDGRWIALEHELWSYATRNGAARAHLARRYQAAWAGVEGAASGWVSEACNGEAGKRQAGRVGGVGAAVIGTLLGLEMMRRVEPAAVPDAVAIRALCGVVTGLAQAATTATTMSEGDDRGEP